MGLVLAEVTPDLRELPPARNELEGCPLRFMKNHAARTAPRVMNKNTP